MGIDGIEILKPAGFSLDLDGLPPRKISLHNPSACGGRGICLTCSVRAYLEVTEGQEPRTDPPTGEL